MLEVAGSEKMVPLVVERSIEMVVGMYGVMNAGSAYVPLGHDAPVERLQWTIEDIAGPGSGALLT